MKRTTLFIFLAAAAFMLHAAIYKWTDSSGVVHYTDRPHEGAQKVTVPNIQSYSTPSKEKQGEGANSEEGMGEAEQQESTLPPDHEYKSIKITQPENEATIRNNQGFVVVAVQLQPDLYKGDKLQVLYDGAALGEPQTSLVFQLTGIFRGAHKIQIQVLDAHGNVIIKSDKITIFMHRPKVGGG